MATIDLYDANKNKIGELEINDDVFNVDVKEHLIHEAIRVQLTNRRAGTVGVKNRSEVAGSGKKPFRQKGTGQARQGCRRAPQYPGGGVAFGPQSKEYNLSMNKKAHKYAVKSALTYLFKENRISVLNCFDLQQISTKSFVAILKAFYTEKALVVIDEYNDTIEKSSRNVKGIKVVKTDALSVYDMMKYGNIIFTEAALQKIEGALLP